MITVIIPAYNAEETIERAVRSIQANAGNGMDIEILVIDDGSTDATSSICNQLAQADGIRVIHTENHGMVAARNAGLREAKGEYIGFVDSDDWIEPDMYRTLLTAMTEYDADLAACGVIQETEYGTFPEPENETAIISEGKQIYRDLLYSDGFRGYRCNKLYKQELIPQDLDGEITQCEDLLFNAAYCAHIRKAVYIQKPFYHYLRRKDSADFSYSQRKLSLMDAYEKLNAIYAEEAPQYAYLTECKALKAYLHYRARTKIMRETDQALLQKIKSGIKKHVGRVMAEKKISPREKLNITLTYAFPKTMLRAKQKAKLQRHKRGIWES